MQGAWPCCALVNGRNCCLCPGAQELIMLDLGRTSGFLAGHVMFLSAKYRKEFLPVGTTTHWRGMRIVVMCPEHVVSIASGAPCPFQLPPTHAAWTPSIRVMGPDLPPFYSVKCLRAGGPEVSYPGVRMRA